MNDPDILDEIFEKKLAEPKDWLEDWFMARGASDEKKQLKIFSESIKNLFIGLEDFIKQKSSSELLKQARDVYIALLKQNSLIWAYDLALRYLDKSEVEKSARKILEASLRA